MIVTESNATIHLFPSMIDTTITLFRRSVPFYRQPTCVLFICLGSTSNSMKHDIVARLLKNFENLPMKKRELNFDLHGIYIYCWTIQNNEILNTSLKKQKSHARTQNKTQPIILLTSTKRYICRKEQQKISKNMYAQDMPAI